MTQVSLPRSARGSAAPAPAAGRPERTGYFASHWRGEQSLVRSYWINNILVASPLAFVLTGLMAWISAKGDSLQVSAIVLLMGFPLLVLLNIWCVVGGWRAAGHYRQDGGSGLWSLLARLSLGLGALQLVVSMVFGFLPQAGEFWQMARGIDPIGQATLSLSDDGRSLKLEGTIGLGDGDRLRSLLASEPAKGLRRIELSSPGGRVREAEKMAEALKKHGHASRVVGTCASACTLVFLAGQPRQVMNGAQLGFHRASTGTYNPVIDELANQDLARSYRALGLPEPLIEQTLSTPSHSIWFAPRKDLLLHRLIAPLPQTLAIDLPPAGSAEVEYLDALHQHPVWEALEQHTPGTLAEVAGRIRAAHGEGAPEEDVQAAAVPQLARLMPALIGGSDAVLRRRYVQLVAEQLKALKAPAKKGERPPCKDLLDGRLAVRQQLPQALQVRESEWLLDAATGAAKTWRAKPPSPLEMEVLERSVGSAAIGMLSRLWADAPGTSARDGAASCERAIALLDHLPSQPALRRDLVERMLFQPR